MINKKVIMIIGMVLLVAGLAYASGVVFFGGNAYESSEDKLVLDIDLNEDNYNSTSKVFTDDSGEGNDGTSNNDASFTTDKYGKSTGAMSFDGSSDYVSASLGTLNAPFSVEAWCYFNNLDQPSSDYDYCLMIGVGNDMISFSRNHVDNLFYSWSEGVQKFGPALLGKQWIHIVVVYSTSAPYHKLYIDGINQTLTDLSGAMNTSGALIIGRYNPSSTHYFNGSISEVKIWNRSLSAQEVSALYNSSKPKSSGTSLQKGLIGYWALDDEGYNSNTERITDKTPYENHGTNYGAILTTDQMNQSDRAMYFDGVSDYINLGDSVLYNSSKPATVSFWAKLYSYDVTYPVALRLKTEQSTGFIFFYCAGGSYDGFNFGSNNNFLRLKTAGSIGSSLAGEWNHFTMVYDGVNRTENSSYKLYLNNVEQSLVVSGQFAVVPLINNISTPVSNNQFNGSISDLRIYDRNLSADDVDTLYNSYRPKAASGSLHKGLVLDMPLKSKYMKSSTILTDKTPYSNDGQNNGASVGSDYSTFAPNDNIDCGNNIDFTNAIFSVSIWAYPTTTTSDTYIGKWQTGANPGNNSWLLWGNVDDMYFYIEQSDNSSIHSDALNIYTTNNWYHVVGVANGTHLHIYVDGVLKDSDSYDGTINPGAQNIVLGIFYGNYPFNGRLSSAKIYNRALSESEIKLLYDKGRW